jgi:hypothetical protein
MLKKVFISPANSHKAIAFFEEINKRKEAAKKKFEKSTLPLREKLAKKSENQN